MGRHWHPAGRCVLRIVPDDRVGFDWVRNPLTNTALVDIAHRSADDWRVYRNYCENVGDGLGGLSHAAAADTRRGRSIYMRKGSIDISGYDDLFPQREHSPAGEDGLQRVLAGEMMRSITDVIGDAYRANAEVEVNHSGVLVNHAVEAGTEWWCVHTPGYLGHQTTMHSGTGFVSTDADEEVQYVFLDASIELEDGSTDSGACVVARHQDGEAWQDINIIECDIYFRVRLEELPVAPGRGEIAAP